MQIAIAVLSRLLAAMFVALTCSPAAQAADIENKYGLIRQSEFNERFAKEVEPYWERNVKIDKFTGVKGVEISYATLLVPDEMAAVVISSGRTETFLKYKELAYDLGRLGYSVYIPDHRGQGFSQRLLPDQPQKGHVESFDDYVEDLHKFVEQVVRSRPHKKLLLLAHSMGGGIATRYIEVHPDTFTAAALSSPMHAPDARIFISAESSCLWFRLTGWLCRDCYAGFTAKPYKGEPYDDTTNEYTHSKERYDALLKTVKDHPDVQLGGPTRGWAAQSCAASDAMLSDTKKVRIPVLVLQAGEDAAVTPEGQNQFCSNLRLETGRTCNGDRGGPRRIEGARHELFIEADKFRIPALTAILDFFAAH